MKENTAKPLHAKLRPYWHVDAKWICAILLAVALTLTLPVIAMYRLTAKEPATKLMSYTMAGLTSPSGIDSETGIADIKARVLQKGSETITLAGISVVFTSEDVKTLSPRELRLKVFGAFATHFYDKGAKNFAASQGLDASAITKFEKDSSLLSLFTADAHNRVGKILVWMVLPVILLLSALVFFGYRFGRLVSPGMVLVLVGLPGILLGALASQHSTISGVARSETAANGVAMLSTFGSFIAPLTLPFFASTYLFALFLGTTLLCAAGIGRLVYGFMRRHDKT